MATPSVDDTIEDIGNTLYNSALIATTTVGSRYLTTKIAGMKDRPLDFKLKSIGTLALDVGVGSFEAKNLHGSGLPNKIFT